jgi:CRP-like cAMP-binding protein
MMDTKQLSDCPVFGGLSDDELQEILSFCREEVFKNEDIIQEDSTATSDLYVLVEGRVSIEFEMWPPDMDAQDRAQLAILRPGDVFGEIAFLKGKRRSANVKAIDETRVLQIDGQRLNDLFQKSPHIGYTVMRNMALILAQRIENINFMWRDEVRR